MTRPAVPDSVRDLVLAVVDSYEKLYVLSALYRVEGPLDTLTLAEHVKLSRDIVQEALDPLSHAGVVQLQRDGSYAYERGDEALDTRVAELLTMFDNDPLELSRLMDHAAMERARSAIHERLTSGYASRHLRQHGRR